MIFAVVVLRCLVALVVARPLIDLLSQGDQRSLGVDGRPG